MKLFRILTQHFFPTLPCVVNKNGFYTEKKDIIRWLKKYKVQNYNLVPDEQYGYVVDVKDNVNLNHKKLTDIPVKFHKVDGNFNFNNNQLTSLEFSPQEVGGNFNCSVNQLTSLEFSPQTVGGGFYCNNNHLTSLKFCPQAVDGNFYCHNNQLTSLEFCPQSLVFSFICNNNQLTSLEFCPQTVGGTFYCYKNPDLGELQNLTDFSIIYQEHLYYKEKKDFAYKLEQELDKNDISTKNSRLKI